MTDLISASAMIMMSGGEKPNIKPLSVSQNGSYEVPDGVDGYNPVNDVSIG